MSGNFFATLGVSPLLGRTFDPDPDSAAGAKPVVVVSEGFWRRRGADPKVVGSSVLLDGHPFQIAGVVPSSFRGLELESSPQAWVSIMMHGLVMPSFDAYFGRRGAHWLNLTGRLLPGVDRIHAESALRLIAGRQAQAYPETNRGWSVMATPTVDTQLGPPGTHVVGRIAWLLVAVVSFVLIIACANVANLLLARGLARRREIGIRLALGASRFRLVQQFLTESVALSGAGGAIGLVLAALVVALAPFDSLLSLPGLDVRMSAPVMGLAVGAILMSGIAFGAAPAFQASAARTVGALKEPDAAVATRWARMPSGSLLIVIQVSLGLVLAIGAGLAGRTLVNLYAVPLGFESSGLWTLSADLASVDAAASHSREYYGQALERVRAVPGVAAAEVGFITPFSSWRMANDILWETGPNGERERTNVDMNIVGPGYFGVMKIPVLRGRSFDVADAPGADDVAIVNRSLAQQLWQGDAIGQRVWFKTGEGPGRSLTVVGVVENGRYYRSWRSADRPFVFLPFAQWPRSNMSMHVRVGGVSPEQLRIALAGVDPRVPIRINSVSTAFGSSIAAERASAAILSGCATVGFAMALIGIYSVVAFTVGRRTAEIGLRRALGATTVHVVGQFVGRSTRAVLIGVAFGWLLALVLTRSMASLLYGLAPQDPLTFVLMAVAVVAAGGVAAGLPAMRAAQIEPLRALRGRL